MGAYMRERLPDAVSFFEAEGVQLKGPGKWRSGPCLFHGSRATLRVNTSSGAWVCMSCGEKGGDVLAYAMKRHGLDFIQAAQGLGCWVEDGKPYTGPPKPATLPSRDALQLAAHELRISLVVIGDVQRGIKPSDTDWRRLIEAARRIDLLAKDYA